jgi:hypothetical protein
MKWKMAMVKRYVQAPIAAYLLIPQKKPTSYIGDFETPVSFPAQTVENVLKVRSISLAGNIGNRGNPCQKLNYFR